MEREGVLIHLDISTLDVRDQDASGTPVNHKSFVNRVCEGCLLPFRRNLEFLHGIEILGTARGGYVC